MIEIKGKIRNVINILILRSSEITEVTYKINFKLHMEIRGAIYDEIPMIREPIMLYILQLNLI